MKSFTAYLTDLHKIYEFKVKIVGDATGITEKIKLALDQYKVESCSAGKRSPIAEQQKDFPGFTNQSVTLFDIKTAYPLTSQVARATIADKLQLPLQHVLVRNMNEQAEVEINHEHDEPTAQALLDKNELEFIPGGQEMVGEKHNLRFLQELGKTKHEGEEVKGINNQLFAGKPKKEKAQEQQTKVVDGKPSLLSKQVKLTPYAANVKPGIGKGK
jgi:hypothetical protein